MSAEADARFAKWDFDQLTSQPELVGLSGLRTARDYRQHLAAINSEITPYDCAYIDQIRVFGPKKLFSDFRGQFYSAAYAKDVLEDVVAFHSHEVNAERCGPGDEARLLGRSRKKDKDKSSYLVIIPESASNDIRFWFVDNINRGVAPIFNERGEQIGEGGFVESLNIEVHGQGEDQYVLPQIERAFLGHGATDKLWSTKAANYKELIAAHGRIRKVRRQHIRQLEKWQRARRVAKRLPILSK